MAAAMKLFALACILALASAASPRALLQATEESSAAEVSATGIEAELSNFEPSEFESSVSAQPPLITPPPTVNITVADVLNFALQLEYLEASFYSCAVYGIPLNATLTGGGPDPYGCQKANLSAFGTEVAEALARDEIAHVALLREALGAEAVPIPAINITGGFAAAADAAVNATLVPSFNPYANDVLFYHAVYVFEDVGVTAYKGSAYLLANNTDVLETAAGILAVEAYHAGAARTLLAQIADQYVFPYGVPVAVIVEAISQLRAAASGANDDVGLYNLQGGLNLANADANAVAFGRTAQQVLNIVTLGDGHKGGFFPQGLNGVIA